MCFRACVRAFRGLTFVELEPDALWTPHLKFINSVDILDLADEIDRLIVDCTGGVTVHLALLLKTECSLDHTHYPFDEQVCAIKIYSFEPGLVVRATGYLQDDPDLQKESLSEGSEWQLGSMDISYYRMHLTDQAFPQIVVRFRRKTTFYTVCLVLPMVLTSYMNTLVFLVPLQSGEKVSFLVSIFVSTSVYTRFVFWMA
nr:hypothetical protein BaRGS_029704 [Batillaria attramentaria]